MELSFALKVVIINTGQNIRGIQIWPMRIGIEIVRTSLLFKAVFLQLAIIMVYYYTFNFLQEKEKSYLVYCTTIIAKKCVLFVLALITKYLL